MKVTELLPRLEHVRVTRSSWIARCPAHEDRSPSLSLREGRDGRVLLHCFAGCTIEIICAALGINVNDLFSEPVTRRKPKPRIVRETQAQLAGLRSRLTPRERDRAVTVVLTDEANLAAAITRALELSVEGEIVQVALDAKH